MILFVQPSPSSFMQTDEFILRSRYETKTLYLNQNQGKLAYLKGLIKLKLSILTQPQITLVVIWFADYHAALAVLMAKLTGKKTLVFIGGYDAVCYPEFHYGVYTHWLRGLCARFALRNADHIVANHQALISSENTYYNPKGHKEGIQKLVPKLHTRTTIIYNALTIDKPEEIPTKRQNYILTVGGTPRYQDIYNKGYDLILRLAAKKPDLHFVLVGIDDAWMQRLEQDFQISKLFNVVFLPAIPHDEVLDLMLNANVYLQPSISEGMPNALLEAMLCGCIPVGSNVAGIPTVIGNRGIIFKQRTVEALSIAISQAMNLQIDRQDISESVNREFSLQNRQTKLLEVVSQLMGD